MLGLAFQKREHLFFWKISISFWKTHVIQKATAIIVLQNSDGPFISFHEIQNLLNLVDYKNLEMNRIQS